MPERVIAAGDVTLAATDTGPTGHGAHPIRVLLAHGLTAARRYVVMGSRSLERSGHRVVSYDARGHGASSPAPAPGDYEYERLSADLVAVLDNLGWPRAVLAGASMGAHTILRLALEAPERVAGIVAVTPGYDPADDRPERLEHWDALAQALRTGGVDGFLAELELERVPERWRETVATATRQRLSAHEHLDAVADALQAVPRSRPFADLDALRAIDCPAVVVASRDEVDPGHRLALGTAYAEALPHARLVVEEEGRSPIAWQGGRLSKIIAELAREAW